MKEKTVKTGLNGKKELSAQDRSRRLQCIKEAAERHRMKNNGPGRCDRPV